MVVGQDARGFGPPSKRSRGSTAAWPLLVGVCCLGCGDAETAAPKAGDSAEQALIAARELVDSDAKLPGRAEVVTLADQLFIASQREGRTKKGVDLLCTAAALRERAFRIEGTAADAQEALQLYETAVEAAAPSALSCDLDRTRALLAGEVASDAQQTYRALYLAKRRQTAIASSDEIRDCVASMDQTLAFVGAYRPSSEAMIELTAEGDRIGRSMKERLARWEVSPNPSESGTPLTALSAAKSADAGPIAIPEVVIAPSDDLVAKGPVKVSTIEPYGAENSARIVVNLTGASKYTVGTLAAEGANPPRIYVDIETASAKGVPREIAVGGAVVRVRVGKRGKGTRIVLDLEKALYRRIFYLPDPFRIVIDVSEHPPQATPTKVTEGPRRVRRVALDAGHGGIDTGAVGPTGLEEKSVALDVAHRAASILASELNVETMLTRDSDDFIPLDARTARANAFHADLFISIHCNASEDGVAQGVQTYILDDAHAARSDHRLASLENSTRIKGAPEDSSADLDQHIGALAAGLGAQNRAVSRHFADLLQRSSLVSLGSRYTDIRDGGVRTAGFFVLAGADMPAVLFETSFISNPDDEQKLKDADYRQKLADAIVNAIRAYQEGK